MTKINATTNQVNEKEKSMPKEYKNIPKGTKSRNCCIIHRKADNKKAVKDKQFHLSQLLFTYLFYLSQNSGIQEQSYS